MKPSDVPEEVCRLVGNKMSGAALLLWWMEPSQYFRGKRPYDAWNEVAGAGTKEDVVYLLITEGVST